MIRVAIELNDVVRNINKQILKYYQKDIDPGLDLDDVDEKDDPFKYAKFDSRKAKNEFMYIDYAYEIFGCAKTMNKDLPVEMTYWLANLSNYEDDDVRVIFYSMDEESLTIQSTYFFLSKIGTRVREVVFPKTIEELNELCDVIVTANGNVVNEYKGKKYIVLIKNNVNGEYEGDANEVHDSLSEILKDDSFLNTIHEYKCKQD